nr:MAG TPA: hypothetical protein [Caudoviricetes sp.]
MITKESIWSICDVIKQDIASKFESIKVDDPKAMHYLIEGEEIAEYAINQIYKNLIAELDKK